VKVSKEEIFRVLAKFNPWWNGENRSVIPQWKRAAFREIRGWRTNPPAGRALMLSGARQVGKTTLYRQTIEELLKESFPAANILYATFDHPLLKLAGFDAIVDTWREYMPRVEGQEYLFLDEVQTIKDWQVWVKHQVDFEKDRRIAITGSAMTLAAEGEESGVGRWQTIKLPTLSFYEYLQIRNTQTAEIQPVKSLRALFSLTDAELARISHSARQLPAYFNDYLLRSGFPQSALIDDIDNAQKLLREDIVDKVLKRDMTALFGVRSVLELEQVFLYLCRHDSGILDMKELSGNLEVNKQTAGNFISLLESTHLIYRLMPHGYGKAVLRGQPKIYLADAALAGSVFLKGRSILDDPSAMGVTVETALFKHVFTHYYVKSMNFSYWRGRKGHEVDIIAETGNETIPFEVKYRGGAQTGLTELKGLCEFCADNKIKHGYVMTKDLTDIGILKMSQTDSWIAKIPAALACYWLGRMEIEG
jgi:uncharacterized protein